MKLIINVTEKQFVTLMLVLNGHFYTVDWLGHDPDTNIRTLQARKSKLTQTDTGEVILELRKKGITDIRIEE